MEIDFSSCSIPISSKGSPFTTMRSATLEVSIVPKSSPIPTNSALVRVAEIKAFKGPMIYAFKTNSRGFLSALTPNTSAPEAIDTPTESASSTPWGAAPFA